MARINLYKRHPESLKLVHLLPAVFTLGTACLLLLFMVGLFLAGTGAFAAYRAADAGTECITGPVTVMAFGGVLMLLSLAPLLAFSLIICIDSALSNRSLKIGLLSVLASFIQLLGYGTGFIRAWWARCVMGRNEELQAFKKSFYK